MFSCLVCHAVNGSTVSEYSGPICEFQFDATHLARHRFSVFPHHPFISPIVLCPYKAVTDDFEFVGASKVDEAVGGLKVPLVFGRPDTLWLHAVFGRDNLRMLPDQSGIFRVLHDNLADTDADLEAVADSFFQ